MLASIRAPLARWADRTDHAVARLGPLARLLLVPLAYGIAAGVGVFAWTHPALRDVLLQNQVSRAQSWWMLAFSVTGVLATTLACAVRADRLAKPTGSDRLDALAAVLRAVRVRGAILVALPVSAALAARSADRDGGLVVLALAAATAAPVAVTVYSLPVTAPRFARAVAALPRAIPPVLVGLLFAGFAGFLAYTTLLDYVALHTRTYDLGLYDNLVWHCAHGDWLGTSLLKGGHHGSAHFDPILVFFAPLYRLRPRADTLLVLQVVWIASTVVPIYLLAASRLGNAWYGVAFAAIYALHPAAAGTALYEFHSLAMAGPFLVWLLYFLETGRIRPYGVALAMALLCREDVALLVLCIAIYAMGGTGTRTGTSRRRIGWVTGLVAILYFAAVKLVFMDSPDPLNAGQNSYSFTGYFRDLIPNHNGAEGLLLSIFGNPLYVAGRVLTAPKWEFALLLLLPLGLLPLFSGRAAIMLLYGAVFCLLASKPAVFSIAFHYATMVLPVAFVAAISALAECPRWRVLAFFGLDGARTRRALLAFALGSTALVFWKFGPCDPAHEFDAGFVPIAHSLDDRDREQYAWVREAVARIPADASVAATPTMGPFVSNRREVYEYPKTLDASYAFVYAIELTADQAADQQARVARGDLVLLASHEALALYATRVDKRE
jgi:uncharacterized membrane protein